MKNKKEEENKPNESISVENISGDVVISQNQSGGITAHTVNNYGTPKRSLTQHKNEIVTLMKQFPIATYRLEYSTSDIDSNNLAVQLDSILLELNWQRVHPIMRLGGPPFEPGVSIYTIKDTEPMASLANLLWQALGNKGVQRIVLTDVDNVFRVHGWPAQELPDNKQGVVIVIGPNTED